MEDIKFKTYIQKLYEPTGVVVTEISSPTHPYADYILV
jgi:hypothetical protein